MRNVFLLLLVMMSSMSHAKQSVHIDGATVRIMPPTLTNTAGYLTLTNRGKTTLSLVSASSSFAQKVEIHGHEMVDGVMHMFKKERVSISPGQQAVFQPGGLHLMLFGINPHYRHVEQIDLQLTFSDGSVVKVDASVVSGESNVHQQHKAHQHHHHQHE